MLRILIPTNMLRYIIIMRHILTICWPNVEFWYFSQNEYLHLFIEHVVRLFLLLHFFYTNWRETVKL